MRYFTFIILIGNIFLFSGYVCAQETSVSSTLVDQSWQALVEGDFEKAKAFSEECHNQFKEKAYQYQQEIRLKRSQKGTLSRIRNVVKEEILPENVVFNNIVSYGFRELNDAGTALFIQAEALKAEGSEEEAKINYRKIVENYPDAHSRDPRGWFWNVADVAQDRLDLMGTPYDYEDYKSETLVKKAWEALKKKDYKGALLYAQKCVALYNGEATKMQAEMKDFAVSDKIAYQWALNDVATAYFILGEINFQNGNETEAKELYQKAVDCGFAQCWDLRGWHWKVAEVSQDKIDTIGTVYDFEDYKSETLIKRAWESLNKGDFKGGELYAKKCIYLYEKKAEQAQQQLKDFAKGGFIPYYWALNDVATAYFILGESYSQQNDVRKAGEMYSAIGKRFKHAQCWDPRGWYWKVADVALKKIRKGQ